MAASVIMGGRGEITLPDDLRDRYGFTPDTPIRIVETRSGILLVPLADEPMSEGLAQELAEWQSLSLQSWETFSL